MRLSKKPHCARRWASATGERSVTEARGRVHYESFKNLTASIQSIITSLALVGGGVWAYWRFVLNRESVQKVDLDIDLTFVRKQKGNWIIEGVALVKNPGNVRLDFREFTYEIHYALLSDDFAKQATEQGATSASDSGFGSLQFFYKQSFLKEWPEGEGSKAEEQTQKAISPPAWSALRLAGAGIADEDSEYWYLEPGERTRHSFLASLPADTTIVLLQCDFYDKNRHVESARKSYAVPMADSPNGHSQYPRLPGQEQDRPPDEDLPSPDIT
jgi:hypothetical protein